MARVFDIVEHPNVGSDELAYREPQSGSGDFRLGSQVIVRENQAAVFVRDGHALDTFGPGSHTIATANVPLLVDLIGKAFNNETPFKAEVYFMNLQDFPQVGWGTSQPLALGPELGVGFARGALLLRIAAAVTTPITLRFDEGSAEVVRVPASVSAYLRTGKAAFEAGVALNGEELRLREALLNDPSRASAWWSCSRSSA